MNVSNKKLIVGGILSVLFSGDTIWGMLQKSGWPVVMPVRHNFWDTTAGEKIISIFNGEKPTLLELSNLLDSIISREHDPAVPSREEKRSIDRMQGFILGNWDWIEPKLKHVVVGDNSDLNPEQENGVMQNALPVANLNPEQEDDVMQNALPANPIEQLNVAPQAMVRPSRAGRPLKEIHYERLCSACGNEKARIIKNCFEREVPLSAIELFEWLKHYSMGREIHEDKLFESLRRVDYDGVYNFIREHLDEVLEIAKNCPKWVGVEALYEEQALLILFGFFPPNLITKHSAYNLVENMFFTFHECEGLAPFAYIDRSRSRIWEYIVNNELAIRNLLMRLIFKGYTAWQLLSKRDPAIK